MMMMMMMMMMVVYGSTGRGAINKSTFTFQRIVASVDESYSVVVVCVVVY